VTTTGKPFVIALEEHYSDQISSDHLAARTGGSNAVVGGPFAHLRDKLLDVGDGRLQTMDEAGIDVQVLSHMSTMWQYVDPGLAVDLAFETNDRLRQTIDRHPDRFAGFATLPMQNPPKAANELERCVTKLGFKGAMIWGRTQDSYHDDRRFWPVFERAAALDVPIYLHPGRPHPAMAEAFYGDYLQEFPLLNSAGWGYTLDTSNQALRMILSGLFEAFPRLNIVLGHLGEGLPFLLDRVDEALKRPGQRNVAIKDTFCQHFYVTTSGFFSTPALLCTLMQIGIDRILFSIDWPFVENLPGMKWMDSVPLSTADREKLFNGNARRLLKM
jgi:2,3-dihydroxybenzoate decarboxylase